MTCIYDSHPWHLKFKKIRNNIFIEEMDNSETIYDNKNINSHKNLNIEATLINEFIKEQLLEIL